MAARTDGENVPVFGHFHQKCGDKVALSEGRRVASGRTYSTFDPFPPPPIAFSNDPIPKGVQFSVKVLQESKDCALRIGVTTKDPDSGPVTRRLEDIVSSDQYWTVYIESDGCRAKHKRQRRKLQLVLDRSEGNTFGCHVSGTGELHLHHNGRDVCVAWEGLPTDQPLWGFVVLPGYKVEANYVIAQSHPQGPSGSDQTNVGANSTGHPQDYAGKTFHFVERPPEWLVCAVCQTLAHDPVQANCCGNIYCSQCIERWKTRSNSCPTCRSSEQSDPPFNVFPDRRAYRDVRNLLVHCPNMCGKKMELSAVEDHLMSDNGCKVSSMQHVECEYKQFGCAIVLPRKDMAEHLKTSVEAHLQMTKRRVEEQEMRLQEERDERQLLEVQLKKMEEKAKRERERFACLVDRVDQLELKK